MPLCRRTLPGHWRRPDAAEFFATLESYNRYAILYRVQQVQKPETRAARIEKFVGMLKRGEKLHPPRQRAGR